MDQDLNNVFLREEINAFINEKKKQQKIDKSRLVKLKIIMRENVFEKGSNKCNQCDYESSRANNLRRHKKIHSGEKLNKCNQCEYASLQASTLRTHLKTHDGGVIDLI